MSTPDSFCKYLLSKAYNSFSTFVTFIVLINHQPLTICVLLCMFVLASLKKRILSQLDFCHYKGQPSLLEQKEPNYFLSNFYPTGMLQLERTGREDLRERILDLSPSFTENSVQMAMLKLKNQGLDGKKVYKKK